LLGACDDFREDNPITSFVVAGILRTDVGRSTHDRRVVV
jgi:hypothetical protein